MLDPRVSTILSFRKDPKPTIYAIKKTRLEQFPSNAVSVLTPEEFDVLGVFIMEGGIGWAAALKTQDVMWTRFAGRTIDILKLALKKTGYNPKEVLWDSYPIHLGEIHEKDD